MGVFEQFPYTNYHDLNLDWILKKIQECETDVAHMQVELDEFPAKFTEEFTVVIYQILEEAWHDLLPPVTPADDGKVMSVVAGAWAATSIPNGNVPPASYVDKGKALRVDASGNWIIKGFEDLVGPFQTISAQPEYLGILNSSGVWTNTNLSTYTHYAIPVAGGEHVIIKARSSGTAYYAVLKTHVMPLTGTGDWATGYTGRVALTANKFVEFDLPTDARFFYVQSLNNGNDSMPAGLWINGINIYAATPSEGIVEYLDEKISTGDRNAINMFRSGGAPVQLKWEHGTINIGSGVGSTIALQGSNVRMRTQPFYTDVELHVSWDSTISAQVIYVSDDSTAATITALDPNQAATGRSITIPAGSRFRMIFGYANSASLVNTDPDTILNVLPVLYTDLSDIVYPGLVNWTALGDSITQGYYSYMSGGVPTSALNASIAWATLVAKWNRWSLDNQGLGGSGFLDPDSSNVTGWMVARDYDFTGRNLVTIAYGINDWKGNQPLGSILSTVPATPTTVIGAMQYVIEKIMTSNPECKIVGILPINSCDYGDFEHYWGLGTPNANNVTLEQFVQALIDVYEYYGIEYIDLAHSSVVNRLNIQSLLIDGVHPSVNAHRLLGLELAERISFKS